MKELINYFKQQYGKSYSTENDTVVADLINCLNREQRDELKSRLFHEARILDHETQNGDVFNWLEYCLEIIEKYTFRFHKVYFSPGNDILDTISDLIKEAESTIDLCVFTITDSRLARQLSDAERRGVEIRIITDDRKVFDHGSEIFPLSHSGIKVKIDHSQYHMHHKFGIIDQRIAFTGSFNWTYTASKHNQENLLVTSKFDLMKQYSEEFERLWGEMFSL